MQSTNPTPNIRNCERCGIAYDWRRSSSRSLKMTYCNSLCENADLGFTVEALLDWETSGNARARDLAVFRAAFEEDVPAAA